MGIVILVKTGFLYSLGKIDHSILWTLLPFFMAYTDSGCKLAIYPDQNSNIHKMSISILAICFVFGFFTAGYEKALNWVDINTSTSGFMRWFYDGYFTLGRDKLLASSVLNFPWWLTEIFDYVAVIFELSGVLFLFHSRKTWLIYLLATCFFHLMNTLFLNIAYKSHIAVLGVWLISPFLKRFKFLIFLIPLIMTISDIHCGLIGWILMCIMGAILLFHTLGYKNLIFLN